MGRIIMATRNSALTSWTKRTSMFVKPSSDGWALNGTDIYTATNGILRGDSITPGGGITGYYLISPNLKKSIGWTCEWRMRVINITGSAGSNTLIFQIFDDNDYNNIRFENGKVSWEQSGDYTMDTTDAFHVYKLERAAGANLITLYVDGTSRLTVTSGGSAQTSAIYLFRDADGGNGFQADLDYFHYKNTGNYPNPPFTMGRRAVT
jgi:hypothetical protein